MSKRTKRARRSFTEQFKADAVALVRSSGKSVAAVARDLDLTETALREWMKKAEGVETRKPAADDERIRQLEEEVRVLRMERDFLKKAAAFFARESK
jgi:transposase